MAVWLSRRRHRFVVLLLVYFGIHLLLRTLRADELSYDESEQVVLSQWFRWGYNSQPPLYTWLQSGVFAMFGIHAFSLALLKNAFIAGTYVAAYSIVRRATGRADVAIAGSLGMLTIPQIAWESHRDLSHTVMVTFATAWLLAAVVRLRMRPGWWRYVAVGLVCAIGMYSKYNFAMVILAVLAAAWSLPAYRERMIDRRMGLTILVASALFSPHAVWVMRHPHLASSKTLGTLTTHRSDIWWENVVGGLSALSGSVFACTALTLVIFGIAFRGRIGSAVNAIPGRTTGPNVHDAMSLETARLIERFFLIIGLMLLVMVLSGHALEFKNRWIQPFVCLMPVWLSLRLVRAPVRGRAEIPSETSLGATEMLGFNRIAISGLACMVVVVVGLAVRMVRADAAADVALSTPLTDSTSLVAANMRVGARYKITFPNARVFTMDAVADRERVQQGSSSEHFVWIGDEFDRHELAALQNAIGPPSGSNVLHR